MYNNGAHGRNTCQGTVWLAFKYSCGRRFGNTAGDTYLGNHSSGGAFRLVVFIVFILVPFFLKNHKSDSADKENIFRRAVFCFMEIQSAKCRYVCVAISMYRGLSI